MIIKALDQQRLVRIKVKAIGDDTRYDALDIEGSQYFSGSS